MSGKAEKNVGQETPEEGIDAAAQRSGLGNIRVANDQTVGAGRIAIESEYLSYLRQSTGAVQEKDPEGVDPKFNESNVFKTLVAGLPIVAGISYAVIRVAYDKFYHDLGVEPEEVGFQQVLAASRMLVSALVVIAFWATFVVVIFALAWLALSISMQLLSDKTKTVERSDRDGPNESFLVDTKTFLRRLWGKVKFGINLSPQQFALSMAAILIWPVVYTFAKNAPVPPPLHETQYVADIGMGPMVAWMGGTRVPTYSAFIVPVLSLLVVMATVWFPGYVLIRIGACVLSIAGGTVAAIALAYAIGAHAAQNLELNGDVRVGSSEERQDVLARLTFPAPCVSVEWQPQKSSNSGSNPTSVTQHQSVANEEPTANDLPRATRFYAAYLGSGDYVILFDTNVGQPIRVTASQVILRGVDQSLCKPQGT